MREELVYHVQDPSLFKKSFMYAYGYLPVLTPAILDGLFFDSWYSYPITYGALGLAYLVEPIKRQMLKIYKDFREKWFRYKLGIRLSGQLRAVLKNAGLIIKDKVESFDPKGKKRIEEVVTYPDCLIMMDDHNYYLKFRMLMGQTAQQWSTKSDAFGHALRSDLVKSTIERGYVILTLQHTPLDVNEVIKKTDDKHVIQLGYMAGGQLAWHFDKVPNLLVAGVVGGGKSTFVRNFLSQIPRDWTLKIVDGKQVEFSYMRDYGYDIVDNKDGLLKYIDDAIDEMNRRYDILMCERKNHYTQLDGMKPYILVVDEWITLVESMAKKPSKDEKIAERDRFFERIKMLTTKGRAAGVQLVAILQRADAEFLSGIVRDMFTAKVLLKGSEKSATMMYDDQGKGLTALNTGQGYCMLDGELFNFSFPNYELEAFIQDLEAKHAVVVGEGDQVRSRTELEPELV